MAEEVELCFPQLNTSCWKTKRPLSVSVLIYIVLSFISLLTVTLNLLVIISISHFKQLHTPTNLLLLSLAVSDFFIGLVMLFQIMLIDGCWLLGDFMCALYGVFDFTMTCSSIGTMMLISVDRYVAICDPMNYAIKVTPKRVGYWILLCWISSVFLLSVLMKENLKQPGRYHSCTGQCLLIITFVEQIADLIIIFIIPITVIIVLYMRVFVVAVSQARAMRSHVAAVSVQCSVSVFSKKSEMKAARTLGVVIVVFLFCICPFFSSTLLGQDTLLSTSSAAFIICLFYFNSCLNPIVYAFFYPWFRKSIRLIVTLEILRPGSHNTNMLRDTAE